MSWLVQLVYYSHISKDVGISSMIDSHIVSNHQNETLSLSSVNKVRVMDTATTVISCHTLDYSKAKVCEATFTQSVSLLLGESLELRKIGA